MMSLDKWTDNAKAVLQTTLESAQTSGHPELTPSHLLSALLQDGGVTRALLEKESVDPDRLAGELSSGLNRLPTVHGGAQPATSAALAAVFSSAQNRAQRAGHAYVTATHLLWAVFDKPDDALRAAFGRLGVDAKRVRQGIDELLEQKGAGEEGAESRQMALDRFGRDLTKALRPAIWIR